MSSSIERFKRMTQRSGLNMKQKAETEARRYFRKYLNESPTAVEVQVTIPDEVSVTDSTRTVLVMITDITLNDQRALDEKYIHFDLDTEIDVGCYVKWRGKDWLLVFEETNSFDSHRTFIMKYCNQVFRFLYNGEVYNIPASVTNLTLYSDGLADGVYLSRADAKRNIKIGSNPITRMVDLGHRFMLTGKTVFRVTHIDNFSQPRVIACIILQTAIIPKDDLENNIAYNEVFDINNDEEEILHKQTPVGELEDDIYIEGSDKIFLGSEESYFSNKINTSWYFEEGEEAFTITSSGNGVCNVVATTQSKYIGYKGILSADVDGKVTQKEIVIKNYF